MNAARAVTLCGVLLAALAAGSSELSAEQLAAYLQKAVRSQRGTGSPPGEGG